MGIYGVLWGPMGTYGDLWGPMGTFGDLWGPLGTYGDLWGPMGTYGDLWARRATSAHRHRPASVSPLSAPRHNRDPGDEGHPLTQHHSFQRISWVHHSFRRPEYYGHSETESGELMRSYGPDRELRARPWQNERAQAAWAAPPTSPATHNTRPPGPAWGAAAAKPPSPVDTQDPSRACTRSDTKTGEHTAPRDTPAPTHPASRAVLFHGGAQNPPRGRRVPD